MKELLNKIGGAILHFTRRFLFFTNGIIFAIICFLIYIFTYEPNTRKKVTLRKIKRIRRLTKVKLFLWKYFKWYIRFIKKNEYYESLQKKFGNDN